MPGFASGLRRWWRVLHQSLEPPPPYSVTCVCGATLTGTRKSSSQVRICTLCKQKVFVLGRSPLPPVAGDTCARPSVATSRQSYRYLTLGGLVTAILGLIILLVTLFRAGLRSSTSEREEAILAHERAGETAWNEDKFSEAADEFRTCLKLRSEAGSQDARDDGAKSSVLRQKIRQADLVTNRLRESLNDLLMNDWKNVRDDDLQTLFAQRRGKAVVFDILVFRDKSARYEYERHLGFDLPRLELGGLPGLTELPLRQKQRVIFGARLASLKCDRALPVDHVQRWTVGFEPDSFALVTDERISKAMGLVVDEGLRAVLERQRGWVK
jgi:hypothetical protein